MLALSRPRRQALATLAVALTSMAPTALVGATLWNLNRPEHAREVERDLGRRLNLHVSIRSVRHPRPGEDVVSGLIVRAEAPGKKGAPAVEVARANTVRVRREGRDWAVEAEGLAIGAEGPGQAVALASSLLGRGAEVEADRISLTAEGCSLALGRGFSHEVKAVAGLLTLQGDRRGPTFSASYRVAGEGASTRCELSMARERTPAGVRTTLALRSADGPPLPARVLDPFFDTTDWLGPGARIEGSLGLSQVGSSPWEAEFRGEIHGLDLANLFDRQFPDHRLRGLARVRLDLARWAELPGGRQGSGWVEARGSLTAGPGAIGSSLLDALASEMKFRVPFRAGSASRPEVDFQGLGLKFALQPDGEIRLAGDLGLEYPPDAVLTRGDRLMPLASAPGGSANVRGLRKALVPVSSADLMVPARAESEFLRHLPLPPRVTALRTPLRAN